MGTKIRVIQTMGFLFCVFLDEELIESSRSVELLGLTIDNNLTFKDHVTYLCKKGNQKLHALARISKYVF